MRAPARHRATVVVAALALLVAAGAQLASPAPGRAAAYGPGAPISCPLFPPDNPWNTRVDDLPLDPRSDSYIAHMRPGTGLHPDFGTVWEGAAIGIPYVVVPGDQPRVPMAFLYADESDPGPYPIPAEAPIEGMGGPFEDGDRHVLVLDADARRLYEVYDAHRQPDGSWRAGSGAVWDLTSNVLRPDGWTSADAAGLPILPGLARYDEIIGEGMLDHALRFTVARTQRKYVYPATHHASALTDPDLPPMGLRVRLRADLDTSSFPAEVQVLLEGLKRYGMMVADNGADWYVGGAPDARWDDEALHTLAAVKGGDFEVVDSRCLVPGALVVYPGPEATVREGFLWARQGSLFDREGSSWLATADYGSGAEPLTVAGDRTFALVHRWRDDGRRVVRLHVQDDRGAQAAASVAVTVRNVAPAVRAGAGVTLRPGQRLWRRGTFADPGADRWRGWVSWGDGSARTRLRLRADHSFTLAHRFTPLAGRSCTVTVTVRDDEGARGQARFTVRVRR